MNWKAAFVLVACGAALVAQTPPVTILEFEADNYVCYLDDVSDPTKKATSVAPVPYPSDLRYRTFKLNLCMADIVLINGKPAKGFYLRPWTQVLAATELTPGRSIADVAGSCPGTHTVTILHPDGTPIGSIMASGVAGRPIPPGAPGSATGSNLAVVGGTGAFLGARGQVADLPAIRSGRAASMTEDPAYRRINGGGRFRGIIHLIPMTWPEVMAIPTGPAILHGDDFSPVTAEKPARVGELLMMSVSGLGPVKPNLGPGMPFPAWQAGKEHVVNSPVDVTVNGKAAQVINALGWPGMNNVYRVDFRVPEGTAAGTATLGLSVAWINGPEVKIPVR